MGKEFERRLFGPHTLYLTGRVSAAPPALCVLRKPCPSPAGLGLTVWRSALRALGARRRFLKNYLESDAGLKNRRSLGFARRL